ncbi:hypothetical protein GHT06_016708 [Daphnia sinensis]|uniref:Uncharacterized protein n=1 Tax=Daphnia sinensis TaxID=1820382 RepID=A0AAD5KPT7_9CRUS|nr:hypothetical protein GHT06_016708 [Daphnia sinensis]
MVRGPRMNNNSSWKAATAASTLPSSSSRFSRYIPLRFVHLKCHFDVVWPAIGFSKLTSPSIMAPRNLQRMSAASSDFRTAGQDECTDCNTNKGKTLPEFNWQKTMIQSRIMEKVQDVGERISSQSWLEQMRMLARERSLTSVVLLSFIGLISFPVLVCVLASAFTFLGFVFVEGTLLTIGCCLLGGLLIVLGCLALPLMLFVFVTYTLSSIAFNLFNGTSSKLRSHIVAVSPSSAMSESPSKRSLLSQGSSTPGKSCTDGIWNMGEYLPACVTESDSFLEATVLRRAQMNDKKITDQQF